MKTEYEIVKDANKRFYIKHRVSGLFLPRYSFSFRLKRNARRVTDAAHASGITFKEVSDLPPYRRKILVEILNTALRAAKEADKA